jgi:hypothetical protein
LTHFVVIMLTFGLGLTLHGGVAWPSWWPTGIDFNLMNNLTFVVQIGLGLPGLASLFAGLAHWPPLGGQPAHAYYELGGYFLIVAGALNYFAVCNFYDRIVRPAPRFREQEGLEPVPAESTTDATAGRRGA